jgi:hypothetical protein
VCQGAHEGSRTAAQYKSGRRGLEENAGSKFEKNGGLRHRSPQRLKIVLHIEYDLNESKRPFAIKSSPITSVSQPAIGFPFNLLLLQESDQIPPLPGRAGGTPDWIRGTILAREAACPRTQRSQTDCKRGLLHRRTGGHQNRLKDVPKAESSLVAMFSVHAPRFARLRAH